MRRFSSIVASGARPSTWPTAVEIGPPLETSSTSPLVLRRAHGRARWSRRRRNRCSSACPAGSRCPAIQCVRPSRSRRKWWRYRSGVVGGLASGSRWMARITASLSYSFRPGQTSGSGVRAAALRRCRRRSRAWRRSVPVSTASKRTPVLRKYSPSARALAVAELAQLVVVVGAERGLAVAHEVERSHGPDCAGAARRAPVTAATKPLTYLACALKKAQISSVALIAVLGVAPSRLPGTPPGQACGLSATSSSSTSRPAGQR